MSRYGNVKAGAYNKLSLEGESGDTSEKLNDVERVLTKMGISIRKTNLEFKDFDDVLDEIADKWGTLDNVSKKAIANALAGVRQQESVLILLENYDKYKELVKVSENSKGTAEKKYQSYRESYAAARNELTATLEKFANSSEISRILTELTKTGTKLVEFAQGILKILPGLLYNVSIIASMTGKGIFNQAYDKILAARGQRGSGGTGWGINGIKNYFRKRRNRGQAAPAAGNDAPADSTAAGEADVDDGGKAPEKLKKGSKAGAILAFAEVGASILATAITTLKTAGTTHSYNRETVESSEEAQKKAGGWSAAVSVVPVLGMFAPMIAEAIAADVDKRRDTANAMTAGANKRLSRLQGLTSSLSAIGATESGSIERHKLVQQFKREIFTKENEDLRKLLTRHLGSQNLSTLLTNIESNTEKSTEALKAIQVAQIEAEKAEVYNKYASNLYETQTEMSKVLAELDDAQYNSGMGWGAGAAMAGAGIAAGAAAGAGIGAASGSVAPGIGTAIGAGVGALMGIIAGIFTGQAVDEAEKEIAKENYSKTDVWAAKNTDERIDTVKENIEKTQQEIAAVKAKSSDEYFQELRTNIAKKYENEEETSQFLDTLYYTTKDYDDFWSRYSLYEARSNLHEEDWETLGEYFKKRDEKNSLSEDLQNYNELLDLLEKQTSIEVQILEEMNDLVLQEALVSAKVVNEDKNESIYLTDMTMAQLKNFGPDKILATYANAIEEAGGLEGKELWADKEKGILSEAGYSYLFEEIRKQGDEEINAVLSGEAYTLQEALDLRETYGKESIYVQRMLDSFANSLGVTVKELDNVIEKFGVLTLAESMMSTDEIMAKVDGYSNLMSAIVTGAGSVSSWMQTITTQFPELIAYMGDTSQLFTQSIKRMHAFEEAFINAQYQTMMSSEELFKTIQKDLFTAIGDDAKEELLKNPSLSKLSDVMSWVQGQYGADGKLSDEALKVVEEVKNITKKYGMTITSDVLKTYYDQLINFSTKTIDVELNNLESQKTALGEIVHQREYENKLIEAKLKLEDATKQKKRVYRAGVGWVYESDQTAIESAQKDLDALDVEKRISQLDARSLYLQGQKTELANIYENENYEYLQKLYESAQEEKDVSETMASSISNIKDSVGGIVIPLGEYLEGQLKVQKENKEKALKSAQSAWSALNSSTPGTKAYNNYLELFHTEAQKAVNSGAREKDFEGEGWEVYKHGSNPSSRIKGDKMPWEVSRQDLSEQLVKTKSKFNVNDPASNSSRYIGITNGSLPTTDVVNWILEGVKNGSAIIWTDSKDGDFVKNRTYEYGWTEDDTDLSKYLQRISSETGEKKILISDPSGKNEAIFYENGRMFQVVNTAQDPNSENGLFLANGTEGEPSFDVDVAAAAGTLGVIGDSLGLINELGTEAIVTPQGTLTALPSRTGIIPADITKNLWELGGIAPSLVNMLERMSSGGIFGKSIFDGVGTDESFNIANLVMNITADSSFDVDKFVSMIKTRATLTKNNTR